MDLKSTQCRSYCHIMKSNCVSNSLACMCIIALMSRGLGGCPDKKNGSKMTQNLIFSYFSIQERLVKGCIQAKSSVNVRCYKA